MSEKNNNSTFKTNIELQKLFVKKKVISDVNSIGTNVSSR